MLPRAEDIYASMIEQLEQSLRQDVDQAREILRQLVGAEIRLEPTEGGLTALVTSNYAGLLFARSGVASIDGSGGRILSLAVRIPLYVPRGGESIEPPVTIPDEQEWSALT